MKEFQVIADDVLLSPDEINAIYGDINNVLKIHVNIYSRLIHKVQFQITLFCCGKGRNKLYF